MTIVKLALRSGSPLAEVDLDTLTPKARALAEAIHASPGHQPLGVLCDTGRTKGEGRNHAYLHGVGPEADEIGKQSDLRFMGNLEPLREDAVTTPEEWLEYNARQMPVDAWPIAGAVSRMEPRTDRVPSADAARTDRCLTRDQALEYMRNAGQPIGPVGWSLLWSAGHLPAPRHHALGGRMPLWHIDDLDAYLKRPFERWPVSKVAEHLKYTGSSAASSARKQVGTRWQLYPVGRAPGRGGESEYAADQIEAAFAHRPGKGRRGAPRTGGRFTSADS